MKYILECQNITCREYGKVTGKIVEKMYAIEDNLEFLVEEYKNILTKELVEAFPNAKVYPAYTYDQIAVDLDSANDEFYIGRTGSNAMEDVHLEVVTKNIAEANDRDMGATSEEGYSLADGVYSYYTKLGESEYYFRFM